MIPDFLTPSDWQMTYGERATLEGLLAAMRPTLAIEIGTADGGSLERIASHAGEVHAFDMVEPPESVRELENVTVHTGDSHVLLPAVLRELADAGRRVDFALVDGDHSAEGVRRDVEDLLDSPALHRGLIVVHDTANEEVRRGLEAIPLERWEKVQQVDLDFITGSMYREPLLWELWGGLGVFVVDAERPFHGDPRASGVFPGHAMLVQAREQLTAAPAPPAGASEDAELGAEIERLRGTIRSMQGSASWRITAPLRRAGSRLRTRGG